MARLEAGQNKILRRIREAHHYMSNQTIQNDLQMQYLTKFIQKSAKHLYGNINNTPNEIIYKYLDYDPTLHEN